MFQFFSAIGSFISIAVNAVVSFFFGLIALLVSMVEAVAWIFGIVVFMPPFLTAFILVPVSLAIMYQVFNKGS